MSSIILLLLLFLIPIFYERVVKEQGWGKIREDLVGKYQGHKKELVGSLALFSALIIGFLIITVVVNIAQFNDLELVEKVINESVSASPVFFIASMFVVVLAEEFFFRAFLVKRLGVLLSTVAFTLLHIGYGSYAELFGVFFLGLILAYWYKKKNSLLQNYAGHMLYNFFAVAMYFLI